MKVGKYRYGAAPNSAAPPQFDTAEEAAYQDVDIDAHDNDEDATPFYPDFGTEDDKKTHSQYVKDGSKVFFFLLINFCFALVDSCFI